MESVFQIMQNRINGKDKYTYRTTDAIAYSCDGRIKIVLDFDPKILEDKMRRQVNDSLFARIHNGVGSALPLTDEGYNLLDGEEFLINRLGRIDGLMAKQEVKRHPVWKALAREQKLLNDYTDYVFAEIKKRKYYTGMNVCLDFATQAESGQSSNRYISAPRLWMWFLDNIEINSSALAGKYASDP